MILKWYKNKFGVESNESKLQTVAYLEASLKYQETLEMLKSNINKVFTVKNEEFRHRVDEFNLKLEEEKSKIDQSNISQIQPESANQTQEILPTEEEQPMPQFIE